MLVGDLGTWPDTVGIGDKEKGEGRRIEYRERREENYEHLNNLKEVENLEFLN